MYLEQNRIKMKDAISVIASFSISMEQTEMHRTLSSDSYNFDKEVMFKNVFNTLDIVEILFPSCLSLFFI